MSGALNALAGALNALSGALNTGPPDGAGGSFWLPPQGSSSAPGVDRLFTFIFVVSAFFFALIVVLAILFVIRYRKRPGVAAPDHVPTHNTPLEVAWTAIPLGLVFVIFYFGFKIFLDVSTPPKNAYEIQVTAQRWKWTFTYPNGHVDESLHVPLDTPVLLVMTSEDVIHSFFVPDFRLKRDVVPGRYNKTWFRATQLGAHDLLCAEYCGTNHSGMLAQVIVQPPAEFDKWLAEAGSALSKMPPAEAGAEIFRTRGCAQCHSPVGKASTGPTLKAVFGSKVPMRDGTMTVADEDYIRESIMDPQAKVVAGFDPVMPTYKGRLKDDEITALIAYIKSLAN